MRIILSLLFLILSAAVFAQTGKVDSLKTRMQGYDSIFQKRGDKVKSVQSNLDHQADSLKNKYKQKLSAVDSIDNNFHQRTDSVQQALGRRLSSLNVAGASVQHKIDSLKALNLPTEKYTHDLDSVNQTSQKSIAEANQKIQSIKAKTTDKLKGIDLPPELQSKVTGITKNVDGFKLPDQSLKFTSLNLPSSPLANVGDVNLSSVNKLSEMGKLPEVGGELKDLQGNLKDVTKVTGEVGAYQKDIQNVTSGNLNEVKQMPKALETKAADVSGVSGLQNETKALDQYKDQLGAIKNPEAMKQEVAQQVQQQAINHFAGKEQVLQQAMDKMAKYKKKYSSLQSLSELGKKRLSEMHGKPLIERIIPGLGLQFARRGALLIDMSPYVGYRLTGRLTTGIGWNQRVAYTDNRSDLFKNAHVYGPRVYTEYNLFKGFFPRLEIEALNTYVPTRKTGKPQDADQRDWVMSAFAGLKKSYKISKHVYGYSSVMINLYNPRRRSPYADLVNMRIGFEFPMTKKVKVAKKH